MLRQRIVTGIIYALSVFAVLFLLPPVFKIIAFFLLCFGCFIEWMRLVNVTKPIEKLLLAFLFFAVSMAMLLWPQTQIVITQIGCVIWAAIFGWLIWCISQQQISSIPRPLNISLAFLTLLPLQSGLLIMEAMSQGALWLLMLFLIVWSSDSFAYLFGMKLGRHKIAPIISPGKSVEGLMCGGIITVILIGIYIHQVLHQPYSVTTAAMVAIGVAIAFFGDLFESALKRLKGVKDSGNLLPGHGGLLDRFDSLIALTPFVAIALSRGVA